MTNEGWACLCSLADLCLPQQTPRAASEDGARCVGVQLGLLPGCWGSLLLGCCSGSSGSWGGSLGADKQSGTARVDAGTASCALGSRCTAEGLHFYC